jgi:hypothetical protein
MGGMTPALQPLAQASAGPFAIGQVVSPLRQRHFCTLGGQGQIRVGVARNAQQGIAFAQQLLGHA